LGIGKPRQAQEQLPRLRQSFVQLSDMAMVSG
jgi:hypothetical protein